MGWEVASIISRFLRLRLTTDSRWKFSVVGLGSEFLGLSVSWIREDLVELTIGLLYRLRGCLILQEWLDRTYWMVGGGELFRE